MGAAAEVETSGVSGSPVMGVVMGSRVAIVLVAGAGLMGSNKESNGSRGAGAAIMCIVYFCLFRDEIAIGKRLGQLVYNWGRSRGMMVLTGINREQG